MRAKGKQKTNEHTQREQSSKNWYAKNYKKLLRNTQSELQNIWRIKQAYRTKTREFVVQNLQSIVSKWDKSKASYQSKSQGKPTVNNRIYNLISHDQIEKFSVQISQTQWEPTVDTATAR